MQEERENLQVNESCYKCISNILQLVIMMTSNIKGVKYLFKITILQLFIYLCVKLIINFYLGTAARTKRKSKGVIFIIYMFLNIY